MAIPDKYKVCVKAKKHRWILQVGQETFEEVEGDLRCLRCGALAAFNVDVRTPDGRFIEYEIPEEGM